MVIIPTGKIRDSSHSSRLNAEGNNQGKEAIFPICKELNGGIHKKQESVT